MILNKENTFTENNRFLVYSDQLNATRKQILDETEEMISRSAIQTFEDEGETITANDASYLASLTVDGKAVQDGTPTPSNPVPIKVIEGHNLFGAPIAGWLVGMPTTNIYLDGLGGSSGTLFVAEIPSNTMFTISAKLYTGMNRFRIILFDADPRSGERFEVGHFSQIINTNNPTTDQTSTFSSGNFTWVVLGLSTSAMPLNLDAQAQLEKGSTATPYVAAGAIGLVVGGAATSIPLQGNVLASLPDGTRDTLTVDGAGHCMLTKNTYTAVFDGDDSWVYQSAQTRFFVTPPVPFNKGNLTAFMCNQLVYVINTSVAGVDGILLSSNGNIFISIDATHPEIDTAEELNTYFTLSPLVVIYRRETPLQIDLGYISMPAIPDGATISITAQVTPTIAAKWWTKNQSDVAAAFGAVSSDLGNIQSQIDALDARVTALESANSKNLLIEKLEDSKETTKDEISEEPEELEEPEEAEELEEQEQMPLDDEE